MPEILDSRPVLVADEAAAPRSLQAFCDLLRDTTVLKSKTLVFLVFLCLSIVIFASLLTVLLYFVPANNIF